VRTPIVDVRVMEFAATVPESMCIGRINGHFSGKQLLKKVLAQYYPGDFLERPKWDLRHRSGTGSGRRGPSGPPSGIACSGRIPLGDLSSWRKLNGSWNETGADPYGSCWFSMNGSGKTGPGSRGEGNHADCLCNARICDGTRL